MNKQDKIHIALIITIPLLISVFWLKFMPNFPVEGDSISYTAIAKSLSAGQGFAENNKPSAELPGYPFFLSIAYSLFGKENYLAIKIIQFFILSLIGVFVYFIAKKLQIKPILAFGAALLTTLWPYLLLYANLILTEILFSLCLIFLIWYLLKINQNFTLFQAAILGILIGLSCLVRATFIFMPFWIIGFLMVFNKKLLPQNYFKKSLIIIAFFILALTPWTIRNYIQFNKFIPLYPSINSIISKGYVTLDYTQGPETSKSEQAGLKTIVSARLKNVYLFWNPGAGGTRADALIEKYPLAKYLYLLYKIFFFSMLAFAFYSLRFFKEKNVCFLWMFVFYFWLLHTALFPYPRFTLPIIPAIIILAFYSVNKIIVQLTSANNHQDIAG